MGNLPETILYHERSLDPKLVYPITIFADYSDKLANLINNDLKYWKKVNSNSQVSDIIHLNIISQRIFIEMTI